MVQLPIVSVRYYYGIIGNAPLALISPDASDGAARRVGMGAPSGPHYAVVSGHMSVNARNPDGQGRWLLRRTWVATRS